MLIDSQEVLHHSFIIMILKKNICFPPLVFEHCIWTCMKGNSVNSDTMSDLAQQFVIQPNHSFIQSSSRSILSLHVHAKNGYQCNYYCHMSCRHIAWRIWRILINLKPQHQSHALVLSYLQFSIEASFNYRLFSWSLHTAKLHAYFMTNLPEICDTSLPLVNLKFDWSNDVYWVTQHYLS